MAFKINIGEKSGKTWKVELDSQEILEKKLNDIIQGEILSPELKGYEFEITGASDKSGFTSIKEIEGIGIKKVLLKYGKGMNKKPRKEGKKKIGNPTPKGLKLRKSVRGNTISEAISQINLKVIKEGNKKLEEIYGKKEETQ